MPAPNDVIDCPFCRLESFDGVVAANRSTFAIRDTSPVTHLHTLVLPKRHAPTYFHLGTNERRDIDDLLFGLRDAILASDSTVVGFNIGTNVGAAAGQTIDHCHVHLIPRRIGDVANPRGGVRGVIPEKMNY
jgi:diadenosine tetraphosphate (Ap4A) HIT family hydrolase